MRDARLLSARAGGINFASGQVLVERAGLSNSMALTAHDDLRAGDVVKTGGDGRVEVLLNPGSYLRVGADAEFSLSDDSLEHLRLKLTRGAAVAEVIGFDDARPALTIDTPQTQIVVLKSGIYHIAVLAGGSTEVAVFKGRAQVGSGALLVQGGRKVIVGNGAVAVAKLDKREADALDAWSRERAEQLAKANGRITRNRTLTSALQSMNGPETFGGIGAGWWPGAYGFRGNGYWVYDGFARTWVFVPFYWRQVSCPYGFGYHNTVVVTPPQGTLPNNVPCRGCQSNKLPDQRVGAGGGFPPNDGFSRGGGKFPSGSAPAPAPAPAPPSKIASPSKGGGGDSVPAPRVGGESRKLEPPR
ncbi:MAG: FecR domain-containing protein [Pyrinomonadaceae bacterium]